MVTVEKKLTAKHAPFLGKSGTLRVGALCLARDNALGLVKGNAKRFGAHARSPGVLGFTRVLFSLASAHILDLILTLFCQTVGDDTDVLVVKGRSEVVPVGDELPVSAVLIVCTLVHVALDCFK